MQSDDKRLSQSSGEVGDALIERELGIESVTFRCEKELGDKLRQLAASEDMRLEPFVRRICQAYASREEAIDTEPLPGRFAWSDMRRLEPVARDFGFSAGQPVDRFYIDGFLSSHRQDIRGHVLEVADDSYSRRFGDGRVDKVDILHVEGNEKATLIGDLASGAGIPKDTFDCIILTQTLPFIFDVSKAVATCYSALAPEGVLLCTVNGISQISRYDMDRWGDYWRFTDLSLAKLLETVFDPADVSISTSGNVLSAMAFLLGLPIQELTLKELASRDQDYQILIGARAIRRSLAAT